MDVKIAALLLVLYSGIVSCTICTNKSIYNEFDAVLAEYDRTVFPALPMEVQVHLNVRMASLDERRGAIRILADLYLYWIDPRLDWNYTDCDALTVTAERIWLPEISVLNGDATVDPYVEDIAAKIGKFGAVTWLQRLDVLVPVDIELYDWPKDTQTAVLRIGSRILSTDALVLKESSQIYTTATDSGSWQIVSIEIFFYQYSYIGFEMSQYVGKVHIKRRAPAHALSCGAVLSAAVTLSLAAALLPPHGRAPLYICSSFITAFWLVTTLLRLPPSSSSAPVSVSLAAAVCAAAAAGGAGAALVQYVARRSSPAPAPLRALLAAAGRHCALTTEQLGGSSAGGVAWTAAAKLLDYIIISSLSFTLVVLSCIYVFS